MARCCGFLLRAQRDDARLVLVVTGKGRPDRPAGRASEAGVLRRAVPMLAARHRPARGGAGLRGSARPHGGAGALYVRLRRADP